MLATPTMALAAYAFQSRTASARATWDNSDDGKRQCDEKWQNWYFFEMRQWIHCYFFLFCLSLVTTGNERRRSQLIFAGDLVPSFNRELRG